MSRNRISAMLAVTILAAVNATALAGLSTKLGTGKPLKVFILAGQSNMQGKAHPLTVPRMSLSPESKALHDKILDEAGEPRAHENVSIVYFTGGDEKKGVRRPLIEKKGLLAAGATGAIGPELGFGIAMDGAVDEPILIIKTAWGGKSLNYNFRPPSAGLRSFVPPKGGRRRKPPSEETLREMKAEFEAPQGAYYRLMMKLIRKVLADPGEYCDAYDPNQGYEIGGFAWFQGYNDQFYYPGSFDYYSDVLAHFIRDVRKDLKTPDMPFVIGVIGINGNNEIGPKMLELRKAMAAPAMMPEFKGNVAAVKTADFWDDEMVAALKRTRRAQELWDTSEYWTAIGTPAPENRVWKYTTFDLDPEKQYRDLKKGEEGDERTLTGDTPAALTNWLNPAFDTSKWQKGHAPIGKGRAPGVYKNEKQKKEVEKRMAMIRSPWGEGNMLLMKTTFTLERTGVSNVRLCIHSTSSFHVYLNGHLVTDYPWWKDVEVRRFDIRAEYLKQGINELAFYGNILENRGRLFNAVNLYLEGLSKDKAEKLKKQQDAIATPRDHALSRGKSHQEYHYLGSAYTYSLIGEAMAKAMIELEKAGKKE